MSQQITSLKGDYLYNLTFKIFFSVLHLIANVPLVLFFIRLADNFVNNSTRMSTIVILILTAIVIAMSCILYIRLITGIVRKHNRLLVIGVLAFIDISIVGLSMLIIAGMAGL